MKRWVLFVVLVLAGTLAAVLVPVLAVWIMAADLILNLWRYLWK